MGCSASRFDTLVAKAIEGSSSPFSYAFSSSNSPECSSEKLADGGRKSRSLCAPLVHHPALRKGDTHHLVCLTSSTYGSLVVVDNDPSPAAVAGDLADESSPDSVINTWELMEGLEAGEEGFDSDLGKDLKFNTCDFNGAQKTPSLRLGFNSSKPCESLTLNDVHKTPSSKLGLDLTDSVKKLNDSYVFVEMPGEIIEEEGSDSTPDSKPLWKHLSEESLLSKMDPNVASSYQKALSTKKLGSDEPRRMTKSMGSSQFAELNKSVSVSFTDNASRVNRDPKEKIVLYFTSLRGIRKTYEDCCSVRMILRGFRVMVDEKDISMDLNYRKELQSALGGKAMSLPQLFIGRKHIGGANEVKELHENGELGTLLDGYPIQDRGFVCERCGESRFIPCLSCNGSQKVFVEEEGQMRRCSNCNENGLVRCPICCFS